uniref:Late endosomal/lysosomal adaptor and MAPK and MTOR activator 5 n=1 Tax=Amphora coffeiformis TaxID=265554 RepID=A0A7S3P861_9STRA|mmetsp:Transcript_16305/g.31023  ORF Transcript_16305/g.31023 Transcript_16305/m.31023 type:complete len:117 (+) Transcript_16305:94-444(+)|eukprot:scaffold34612_cov165-Amphora_coffeaeformis.AAC.4
MSGLNSALVDSIVTGSDRQDVGGILCNDPHGLCVATKGAIPSPEQAGVYTNLVRLASKLQKGAQQQQQAPPPLITLEMADKAILVKDYAGYAVAVQIPKSSSPVALSDDAKEDSET